MRTSLIDSTDSVFTHRMYDICMCLRLCLSIYEFSYNYNIGVMNRTDCIEFAHQ